MRGYPGADWQVIAPRIHGELIGSMRHLRQTLPPATQSRKGLASFHKDGPLPWIKIHRFRNQKPLGRSTLFPLLENLFIEHLFMEGMLVDHPEAILFLEDKERIIPLKTLTDSPTRLPLPPETILSTGIPVPNSADPATEASASVTMVEPSATECSGEKLELAGE